jgi:hypothetical protein
MVYLLIPESNFFIDAFTSPEAIWQFWGKEAFQRLLLWEADKETNTRHGRPC